MGGHLKWPFFSPHSCDPFLGSYPVEVLECSRVFGSVIVELLSLIRQR